MPSGFENEVVIFAGPHGAGKDSLENVFTSMEPEASRHVRYSSRAQAPGEVQGDTYHFVTPSDFGEMVERDEFIDFAHWPEGSSGIARSALLEDVQANRFTSITTNFEEALTLRQKLGELQISNTCLFVGPCSQETMLETPQAYLDILAERMARRARASDDIAIRLRKAAFYRELFIKNQSKAVYVDNTNGHLQEAAAQVRTILGR